MPQPLLKSIHTSMWVLWGWGRHCDKRRDSLDLTIQSERYNLWCWRNGGKGWWYCKVLLCTILRQDPLSMLPIYLPAEASYSFLNWSHGRNKLVNDNYLWVHISLIWSPVWFSNQSTPNSDPRSRTQTECINTPTIMEILDKIQSKGNSIKNVYQLCQKVTRK